MYERRASLKLLLDNCSCSPRGGFLKIISVGIPTYAGKKTGFQGLTSAWKPVFMLAQVGTPTETIFKCLKTHPLCEQREVRRFPTPLETKARVPTPGFSVRAFPLFNFSQRLAIGESQRLFSEKVGHPEILQMLCCCCYASSFYEAKRTARLKGWSPLVL